MKFLPFVFLRASEIHKKLAHENLHPISKKPTLLVWLVVLYADIASFPGPAQLSVADTLFRTASDGKLGGAWERG